MNQALDQLQPPLREVLLLCDVEELKYKNIALVLDVPMGTVISRISRAYLLVSLNPMGRGGCEPRACGIAAWLAANASSQRPVRRTARSAPGHMIQRRFSRSPIDRPSHGKAVVSG